VRVLAAAAELFAREGVEAVDVRDIAHAAGVGIGTIYRRFGDKGSLVAALLGDRERDLQDRLLSGPPPLGPGAPPRERLAAFLHALADLTEENLPMLLASEGSASGARYRIGAYNAWRLHAAMLLEQAAPDLDAAWFADLLLAPLDAARYRHQRRELGVRRERVAANLTEAVDRVVAGAGRAPPSG